MRALVVDASVVLAWCFADERSEFAYRILDLLEETPAVVPSLWFVEVANAVLVGERRKRLKPADAARFLMLLQALMVETDSPSESPRRLVYRPDQNFAITGMSLERRLCMQCSAARLPRPNSRRYTHRLVPAVCRKKANPLRTTSSTLPAPTAGLCLRSIWKRALSSRTRPRRASAPSRISTRLPAP